MNRLFTKLAVMLAITLSSAVVPTDARAEVPETIQYSGSLSEDGEPIDGRVDLRFELFDAESSSDALWTEALPGQSVSDGRFVVELGSQSSLQPALEGGARWLQVSVNGVALSPRQRISSAPYAMRAADAETIAGHSPEHFRVSDEPIEAANITYAGVDAPDEVQTALDDLYSLVRGLQGVVTEQVGEIEALRNELDDAVSHSSDLEAELQALQSWVADSDPLIAANTSGLEAAGISISALESGASALSDSVTALESAAASFAQADDVAAIETQLTSVDSRLTAVEALSEDFAQEDALALAVDRVADLEDRAAGFDADRTTLQSLSSEVSTQADSIAELDTRADSLADDLVAAQADATAALSGLSVTNDSLTALTARVDALETGATSASSDRIQLGQQLINVESRVAALEPQVSDMSTNLIHIGADLLDAQSDVADLESTATTHAGLLADLDGRVDVLEDWRFDEADNLFNDLLSRTQYQRAELVGGLPGLVFEGTNLYVRSGHPEYYGGHRCRPGDYEYDDEDGGTVEPSPIANPSGLKAQQDPSCDSDPREGSYCEDPPPLVFCDPYEMDGAGLGNLIIGYGSPRGDESLFSNDGEDVDTGFVKPGMHNLIIGLGHTWYGSYGLVVGADHLYEQDYGAIVGGQANFLRGLTPMGSFITMGGAMLGGYGNSIGTSMSSLVGGYGDQDNYLSWGEADFGDPDAHNGP